MKARKGRRKRPTRLQVSLTLIKQEPRVAILFWFLVAAAVATLGFEFLIWFKIVSRAAWPWTDKLIGLLRCAVIADGLVLASTLWGPRHLSIFSLLDRMLTHLPVAAVGALLIAYASYTSLTKPHSPQRPSFDLANAGIMLSGSFLCFWVFLFYGRKHSVPT
jgi:hypothetical protein